MTYVAHVDDVAVKEYLNNPRGDVAKDLKRRARRVEAVAKRLVGKQTHALQKSIRIGLLTTNLGLAISVGSDLPYALMHHNGTRPHVIRPRTARMLRFKQGGRIVFAKSVHHPGTRPNPYLLIALREAAK